MDGLCLVNARLLDGTGQDPVDGVWVRIEGKRVTGVGTGPASTNGFTVFDCAGRTVMPGLIDCHTHLAAVDFLNLIDRYSAPVLAAKTFAAITDTLHAGFTTVRDAGFTDYGFKQAVTSGAVPGPRMFLATGPLSQTGGHSDFRTREDKVERRTDGLFHPGMVVDGVDRCRWGTREVLRRGADQVKVMASGGCTSPTDDVRHPQFTVEELRAVVYEARARGTYVMAHAYTPQSILNCVAAGVHTIEHANDIDEHAAHKMAKSGTYAVPTIATYELLARDGAAGGMPVDQVEQVKRVLTSAYDGLEILHAAGVRIGSGSDVLGPHQNQKALELELTARVLGPMAAIVAATSTNAELLGLAAELGTVTDGKLADLLVIDGDPLEDITILQDTSRLHLVVADGRIAVRRDPA